jgi:hypothetical protein
MTADAPATEKPAPNADFVAAAVYGSVVAAALIGGFRQEHASAESIALALLSTLLVFWAAHVWSAIVGERIARGVHFTFGHAAKIARAEWPLMESAFAPALVLVLGWAGVFADRTAATTALVVCIAQLFAWGLVVGRRAYDKPWQIVASGAANAALGAALIALEIAVVH